MLELILGADAHLWATVARWYGEFALTIFIVVKAVQLLHGLIKDRAQIPASE